MADNYVQIQIKASDTAKPDLTDLKAKLDELGAKAETAKVDVDDTDGTAKLLAINAKLASLNAKVAKPNVTVAGAAQVEAQLAAIDASLVHLGNDSATADVKVNSMRSRLMSLGGAVGAVTGVGDAMTLASEDASMFQRVMAGASLATGLLEAPVAGVVVATGGLVAGLAAAGAGLGVFGLVAKANYTAASTAATAVQTAQDTYNASLAAGMPKAKAYQAEQKAIGLAYAELSPAQISMSKQIGDMSNAWQSFVQSNTAGVDKVLTQGMGLLPVILKAIEPLMAPVEKALSDIISAVSKAIQPFHDLTGTVDTARDHIRTFQQGFSGGGLQSFIKMLAANAGPAIEKIATAIGHVVVGIGGILKAFMPVSQGVLSGVDKITAAFAKWGSSLSGHTGFQSLMETFKTETPLAMQVLKNLVVVLKNVGSAMAGISTGSNSKMLLQLLGPLSGVMATLSKNTDLVRGALYALAAVDAGKKISGMFTGISNGLQTMRAAKSAFTDLSAGFRNSAAAASDATGVWGTIGGKLSTIGSALASAGSAVASFASTVASNLAKAAAATVAWIAEHAVATATFIAENVAQAASATAAFIAENAATLGIAAAIALLVGAIIYLATHWKQVWGDIKNWAEDAWNFIKGGIADVVSFVQAHWPLILGILLGPIAAIAALIYTNWNTIEGYFSDAWNFIKGVVTTGINAVSSVITAVFNAIVSFITDAWTDVKNAATDAWNFVKSVVTTGVNDVKAILNWFAGLGALFRGWWNDAYNAVTSVVGTMLSFVAGIPGKILSALGNLGTLLFNAGKNVIQGLINGITSMVGSVGSAISSIASEITSHLPLSPAKKGPLSGAGSPDKAGQRIGQMLAQGMADSTTVVSAAAARMAGGAVIGGATGAAGAAGAGGTLQLELVGGGSDPLLLWLRNQIRLKGGTGPNSVQTALGQSR